MVNTKLTPRKDPKCPMCPFRTSDPEAMRAHLVVCGLQRMERRLTCDECAYTTEKSSNLTRHNDRRHSAVQKVKEHMTSTFVEVSDESDKEDWEKSDPGELNGIMGEDEGVSKGDSDNERSDGSSDEEEQSAAAVDPTARVPTAPKPVLTPRKELSSVQSSTGVSLRDKLKAKWSLAPFKVPKTVRPKIGRLIQMKAAVETESSTSLEQIPKRPVPPKVPDASSVKISTGVQTEPIRNRKVVWKTTRYQEGGKDIEIVEMEETDYSDI